MKATILEALERGDILTCDGAMGTMLQRYNIPPGTMPELWNADRPEVILEIHRAYLAAGAQIITANTFGGNRIRMAGAGLAERSAELSRKGIYLAREAVGAEAWVAADRGADGPDHGTLWRTIRGAGRGGLRRAGGGRGGSRSRPDPDRDPTRHRGSDLHYPHGQEAQLAAGFLHLCLSTSADAP